MSCLGSTFTLLCSKGSGSGSDIFVAFIEVVVLPEALAWIKWFIIHMLLKLYVSSVLKYYIKAFLDVLHEKLGLSNDFKIGLTCFRLHNLV